MADKTINELTAATTMGNDDLLVLQQGGVAKKLSGKQLGDYVYNAAAEKVAEVNKAVDDARSSINDIVESVQSMTELGTDTTLTTTGMAADAKAAGDKIKAVEAAAMADLSQGTASGSIVTITDGADNIPVKKMTVDIEPVQEGSGDPSPNNIRPITGWTGAKVTRTGKNLYQEIARPTNPAINFDLQDDGRYNITAVSTYTSAGIYVFGSTLSQRTRMYLKSGTKYLIANANVQINGVTKGTQSTPLLYTAKDGDFINAIWYYFNSTSSLPVGSSITLAPMILADAESISDPYVSWLDNRTYDITFPSEAGAVYGGMLEINEDGSGTLTVDRWGKTFTGEESFISVSDIAIRYKLPFAMNRSSKCLPFSSVYSGYFGGLDVQPNESVTLANNVLLQFLHNGYTETVQDFKTYITSLYSSGTPLTAVTYLATPQTYTLTADQITTLLGINNIWADTGDISEFVYRKAPVDSSDIVAKITEIESIISGREATMTATKNYVSGSFVIVNNILYKLDANVASGETLTPGTNCHMTTVEAEIAERVPNYRSVNGIALSSDVTLTAEDIPYNDSLSEHVSGSVGEVVSDLNQQIAELSLQGKVVSILGDSISTYDGWTPVADGHNLTHRNRYINEAPWYTGTVDDTWWKKLIDGLGATLGINDSWAGSKVSNSSSTNTGDVGPDACMAGITRITNLGANGTPDIILFYGGTNDAGTSVTIGTFDSTITYTLDLTTNIWSDFATAYKDAIMRLQHYYPFAKIVVLLPTYTSTYYNTANLDKYNEVIKEVCDYFGVDYFDLRRCGINYANLASTLGDGVHPTVDGFALMENYVRSKLFSIYRDNGVENVVYSVTNILSVNQNADRYIKGVSSGNPYSAIITGPIRSLVKVEMGGIDITSTAYNEASGAISIQAVTGDIIISEKTLTQYTNRFSSASSYTNAVNTGGYGWADSSATASIINKPVNLIKIKTSASSGTLEIGVAASVNATAEQITQVQSVSFDSSMISGGYAYVKLPNTITLTGTQLIVLYPENAPNFIWYYRIGGSSGTGFYTRVPVVRTSGTAWSSAADALLGFDYFYVS